MTLLEAIVAMVILSLVGVSCLELAHGSAQLQSSSIAWNEAVSEAESRMATAVLSAPSSTAAFTGSRAAELTQSRHNATVSRVPWRNGLDDVSVTVSVDDGRSFTLHRLVPSTRSAR